MFSSTMQGSEIKALSYLCREASWNGKEEQIQVKLNKPKPGKIS